MRTNFTDMLQAPDAKTIIPKNFPVGLMTLKHMLVPGKMERCLEGNEVFADAVAKWKEFVHVQSGAYRKLQKPVLKALEKWIIDNPATWRTLSSVHMAYAAERREERANELMNMDKMAAAMLEDCDANSAHDMTVRLIQEAMKDVSAAIYARENSNDEDMEMRLVGVQAVLKQAVGAMEVVKQMRGKELEEERARKRAREDQAGDSVV